MLDNFGATSGALTGDTATSGQTWASMGGLSDANDFTETGAPDNAVVRTDVSDTTTDARYGRGVLLGSTTYTNVRVGATIRHTSASANYSLQGVIARFVDNDNFLIAVQSGLATTVYRTVAGVGTNLGVSSNVAAFPNVSYKIAFTARSSGAWSLEYDGNAVLAGVDSALATGGALASGKSGLYDWIPYPTANTRTYSDFKVSIPPAESIALNAGRKAEFRDDGTAWRQDSTGTYYGYPQQQTIPVAPQLGPSSHGQPANRILALTSRNNPDLGPDPASDPFVLRVYAKRRYAVSRWEN